MKNYIVGIPLAILMSPVIIAGMLFKFVADYFVAGIEIHSMLMQYLSDWIDE